MKKNTGLFRFLLKISCIVAVLLAGFSVAFAAEDNTGEAVESFKKGPHHGRLLEEGDFSVELAIFEKDQPPQYRAWATYQGKALSPSQWQLSVSLARLGGKLDHFTFVAKENFLQGSGVVAEPHSFDVKVNATYQGRDYQWSYPSYEGRVELSAAMAQETGISTAVAQAASLKEQRKVYGQVQIDHAAIREVSARFPGVVQRVHAHIGDEVRKGDVLAQVEANDSLRVYTITAPISGKVIDQHAHTGEMTDTSPLFVIADERQLLAVLNLFPGDAAKARVGQTVLLEAQNQRISGHIVALTPMPKANGITQARVRFETSENSTWVPGQALSAQVTVDEHKVALAVDNQALQGFRDWQVVFIKVGDSYEIRPLELGKNDGQFSEVKAGLNPGDVYVVGNSYLLKADLEKSGASHDH